MVVVHLQRRPEFKIDERYKFDFSFYDDSMQRALVLMTIVLKMVQKLNYMVNGLKKTPKSLQMAMDQ